MLKIAPSVFAADSMKLGEDLRKVQNAGADLLHLDIMDGHFVPNLWGGAKIMQAVPKAGLPMDVHLMVDDPNRYIEQALDAHAQMITVHAETSQNLHKLMAKIRAGGTRAGVALNPETSPDCLKALLGEFDMVLVMTCTPGTEGQSLQPEMADKVRVVREMLSENRIDAEIEVDGGINLKNVLPFIHNGVDIVVMGRALFQSDDVERTMEYLHGLT